MSLEIVILADAEEELSEAHDHYELQCRGLGGEFRLAVEETFAKLAEGASVPMAVPGVDDPAIRRVFVKRFPYAVVFMKYGDALWVLALHTIVVGLGTGVTERGNNREPARHLTVMRPPVVNRQNVGAGGFSSPSFKALLSIVTEVVVPTFVSTQVAALGIPSASAPNSYRSSTAEQTPRLRREHRRGLETDSYPRNVSACGGSTSVDAVQFFSSSGEGHLGFESTSPGASIGSVGPGRLELSADDWDLVLVLDADGRVTPETQVVFELMFEERLRRVRGRPGDPAIGTFRTTALGEPGELSGSFDIELARCEDAGTGKPLVLRGSFDRLPLGRRRVGDRSR